MLFRSNDTATTEIYTVYNTLSLHDALPIILPLLFLSGIFIPFGVDTPGWIRTVARIFPVKHFADAMRAGFYGAPEFLWRDVLVVAIWGIAGLILAVRFFTWEPRK